MRERTMNSHDGSLPAIPVSGEGRRHPARVVGFFQDETGEEHMSVGYYMVSAAVHDMGERINPHIRGYGASSERSACSRRLRRRVKAPCAQRPRLNRPLAA